MRLPRAMWPSTSLDASATSFRSVASWLSAAAMNERANSGVSWPRRARTWAATRDSPRSRAIASAASTEKASQVQREGRESTRAILGSGGDGTGAFAPVAVRRPRNLRREIPDAGARLIRSTGGMTEKVLIAYGSKHGSTAATADAVAGMLRERGLEVDLSEAGAVTTLADYGAVVVGGSIYTGRWHADARTFIKRFGDDLHDVPIGIFAMGPKTSESDDLTSARQQLDLALKRLPDLSADPIAIFGGVIDPAKLHFPFNRLPRTDARDWEAIEAFADQFAARLSVAPDSGVTHGAGIG